MTSSQQLFSSSRSEVVSEIKDIGWINPILSLPVWLWVGQRLVREMLLLHDINLSTDNKYININVQLINNKLIAVTEVTGTGVT